MRVSIFFRAAALAGLATVAAGAQAQLAGTWLVKAGINQVSPQVSSGDLSAPALPGTKIDVESATSLITTFTYMWTDHWSTELFLGLPYKHDVVGAGAIAGVGKLGSVKQASPTALVQYRFMRPNDTVRPYVGAGLTYATFFGEEGSGALTAITNPGSSVPTTMAADSAMGAAVQLGVHLKVNRNWFVDASVVKAFVKTTTHLSTGQAIETKLDPLAFGVSVGYRF